MSRRDELEGKLSQAASKLSAYRSLMEHVGWKMLVKDLEMQRTGRLLILAEPCSGMGVILQQEFMKGEAAGIYLALNFPETQMEVLKLEMASLETAAELEAESERQRNEVAPGSGSRVDSSNWWGGDELGRTGGRFKPGK
jgi:hypothetical protein